MRIQRFAPGTRVRLRPGPFPFPQELRGREGMVLVHATPYGRRYGIQLDGERRIRLFVEEELEPIRPRG